ncbi:antirepressor [Micromonospora sonchi]|uniref:Antirepressor n=1 Tax=Micromonospora sonchi TaxID=1763543 RepID=A0A917TL83_9ACTN|nr:BRO family protein [Micromonospora sonchi]GGM26603.1 antirepressor [Micromonospora sonchi]
MTTIEVFQFPATGHNIRTILRGAEPWFVGRDACAVLEIAKPENSLALLDADEKDTHSVGTPGGAQNVTIISESGLYSLILRSRKPEAKTFKRWITHDVLPAIRKTGRYDALDTNDGRHQIPQSFADALQLAADQARQIEQQQTAIAELEPRAQQADHFRAADGLAAIASFCNDLQLWAHEHHGLRLRHDEIRDFLGDIGLIIRSDSLRRNEPYAEAIKAGLVRPKHSTYETNTRGDQETTSARLTPKGWGYAWDRAVRRIAEHGSLAPMTAVAQTNSDRS